MQTTRWQTTNWCSTIGEKQTLHTFSFHNWGVGALRFCVATLLPLTPGGGSGGWVNTYGSWEYFPPTHPWMEKITRKQIIRNRSTHKTTQGQTNSHVRVSVSNLFVCFRHFFFFNLLYRCHTKGKDVPHLATTRTRVRGKDAIRGEWRRRWLPTNEPRK